MKHSRGIVNSIIKGNFNEAKKQLSNFYESIEIYDKVRIELFANASELATLYEPLEDAGIELMGKSGGSYGYVEVEPQDVEEAISTIRTLAKDNDIVVEARCKDIDEDGESHIEGGR